MNVLSSSSHPSSFLTVLFGILLSALFTPFTINALQTEIEFSITDSTPDTNSDFLAFENPQELKGAVDLYLDYHFNAQENQRLGVETLYLEQLDVYGDIAEWNVQNIDNFANLFSYHRNPVVVNATNFNLSRWNVSNAEYLQDMFLGAANINFDVSTWDTSKAQHFNGMFEKAASFEGWGLEHWNVSQGQLFGSMFSSATSLHPDLDLSSWELTSATDLENMFRDSSYGSTLTGDDNMNTKMCAWVQHLDESVQVTNMFANSECPNAEDPVLTDAFEDVTFCGPCREWVEEPVEQKPAENDKGKPVVEPPQITLPNLSQSQFHPSTPDKPSTVLLMNGKPSSASQQFYIRRGSGFKGKLAAGSGVEKGDDGN